MTATIKGDYLACQKCGRKMVLLLVTAVCDYCDPPGQKNLNTKSATIDETISDFLLKIKMKGPFFEFLDYKPGASQAADVIIEVDGLSMTEVRILKHKYGVPPGEFVPVDKMEFDALWFKSSKPANSAQGYVTPGCRYFLARETWP